MSGFSNAWLDLREVADFAARDLELARRAIDWFVAQGTEPIAPSGSTQLAAIPQAQAVIVDLGAGNGSTLRAMQSIAKQQAEAEQVFAPVWRLVDLDAELLNTAAHRHAQSLTLETYQMDLTQLEKLPLVDASMVTASALFDLASQDFVERLVSRMQQQGSALYAALNYDGSTTWMPEHPLDAAVLDAFNHDQGRDKGFGPALGPQAAKVLAQTLRSAGFQVWERPSPWQLDAHHRELTEHLLDGICAAIAAGGALSAAQISAWRAFRLAALQEESRCTVGHMDILALPAQ